MYKRIRTGFAFVLLACAPAPAQDTAGQFRSELDVFLNTGTRTRVLVQNFDDDTPRTDSSSVTFAGFFELALRPLFRRQLRTELDVFRQKYLTFRAGYLRRTSVTDGEATRENRLIAELTARYPLKSNFILVDRNRGEFRFVENRPFSERYRNRLALEHDVKLGRLGLTPYIYDEVFFDARYEAFTTNRLAAGIQILAGRHMIWEPYVMRQHNTRGTPRYTNAVALKLSLFF